MHDDSSSHRSLPPPRSDPPHDQHESQPAGRCSWRQVIKQVSRQYVELYSLPPTRSIARAQHEATWPLTWLLLFLMIIVRLLFSLPTIALFSSLQHVLILSLLLALLQATQVLSGFFLLVGLQYGMARSAQGDGCLLSHTYTTALMALPLLLLHSLMTVIATYLPEAGSKLPALLTGVFILLGMLSNVLLLQTVQHLPRRTAISVVAVSWFTLLLPLLAAQAASSFLFSLYGSSLIVP